MIYILPTDIFAQWWTVITICMVICLILIGQIYMDARKYLEFPGLLEADRYMSYRRVAPRRVRSLCIGS